MGWFRRRPAGIVPGIRHAIRSFLWTQPIGVAHAAGTGGRPGAQPDSAAGRERDPAPATARTAPERQAPGDDAGGPRVHVVARRPGPHLRQALLLVQPEPVLRWHRTGFRALWRRKSRPGPGRPPLPAQTIALLRRMAAENPLWGAERIRDELQKLGIRAAKRTIQSCLRGRGTLRPRGQTWAIFLRNHVLDIWACKTLVVCGLCHAAIHAGRSTGRRDRNEALESGVRCKVHAPFGGGGRRRSAGSEPVTLRRPTLL